MTEEKFDFTYLSLGAGIQSTAMLLMANSPELRKKYNIPLPAYAVFSDTQSEHPWLYAHLEKLKELSDIPIVVVTAGNLGRETLHGRPGLTPEGEPYKKFVSIPVFSMENGQRQLLRRQFTNTHKLAPIRRWCRAKLGYKPRQRVKEKVRVLIGISLEEAIRMKPSRDKWVTNTYPLVDSRITRGQCLEIIEDAGWPRPEKSACTFCAFHSSDHWKRLKKYHPDIFQEACEFDEAIRNLSQKGEEAPIFLHDSCKPLAEVNFDSDQLEFGFEGFGNECEGMCGV